MAIAFDAAGVAFDSATYTFNGETVGAVAVVPTAGAVQHRTRFVERRFRARLRLAAVVWGHVERPARTTLRARTRCDRMASREVVGDFRVGTTHTRTVGSTLPVELRGHADIPLSYRTVTVDYDSEAIVARAYDPIEIERRAEEHGLLGIAVALLERR